MKKIVLIVFLLLAVCLFFYDNPTNEIIKFQDIDKNGIWDDVEPFIESSSNTPRQRLALENKVKQIQNFLLNPELGEAYKNSSDREKLELTRLQACVDKVWSESNPALINTGTNKGKERVETNLKGLNKKINVNDVSANMSSRLIKDNMLTTKARSLAWVKFNSNLSGAVFSVWSELRNGDPCKPEESN